MPDAGGYEKFKVGIDVGGTFTDFFLTVNGGAPQIHKVLSTPGDPSVAVMQGLKDLAAMQQPAMTATEFAGRIETIVHGTTVTTNATLTRQGAKSGLITTAGLRDALEMRRGIREEQYDNRYTNVDPVVPRYLRVGVEGRLDRSGREVVPLNLDQVRAAVELFKAEGVKAIAICFINSFANPDHEKAAADLVRAEYPDAYLTVSSDLLPSIRFYERLSTTALNSYVGPILEHYLDQLQGRLNEVGFGGILLIMQSNGGVMSPEIARQGAAKTLLSGPAAGPGAGLVYAKAQDQTSCIVVDMGGTSFEAALVIDGPVMVNHGEIDRLRIALPMLGIHTIGAGGGSIGRIDQGGLLRVGPQSAASDPGPACYGKGGALPTTTDANLVLGYLDPEYFAGGKIALDVEASRRAIAEHIAVPLGISVEKAAAGMYRVACNNMAQGVREVTIKRGFDPREFPVVVAGGAGPIHSCLICQELGIPLQIVPRESSILCAVGMLMSDLKHDFVRTFVAWLDKLDYVALNAVVDEMKGEGAQMLKAEHIPPARQEHFVKFDCRYHKQYHEVSFVIPANALAAHDAGAIASAFHSEHNRLYGYSLEELGTGIEIVNVRVQSIGRVKKLTADQSKARSKSARHAKKGDRQIYLPESESFVLSPVYDGSQLQPGNRITGPAMIEEATTAIFVSRDFECAVDTLGSFIIFTRGREDLVKSLRKDAHR